MEYFTNLSEKKNRGQLILTIILIIYLIMGAKVPTTLSSTINNPIAKVIIALGAIILFTYSNPILGVIILLVTFEIIRNSSSYKYLDSDGYSVEFNPSLESYYPTEEKKWSPFTAQHQFPYTLEQEMVKKMTPSQNINYTKQKYSYKPILDDFHDAAPVNYTGVI
jgi:hypothetical protein